MTTPKRALLRISLHPDILNGETEYKATKGYLHKAGLDGEPYDEKHEGDIWLVHLQGDDQSKSSSDRKLGKLVSGDNFMLHKDSAMPAKGGIDFTANKMPLSIQNAGEGIKFHMDSAMLRQLQNAPGFVPIIINIQPMTNLRMFLGLADNQSPQQAASL